MAVEEFKLNSIFENKLFINSLKKERSTELTNIPNTNKEYLFQDDLLNAILLYLSYPIQDALYLSGPTGCGKTSAVIEVAARLNWPLIQTTLSNKSDINDLIGHMVVKNGSVEFEYGPLVNAMQSGAILLINEIDMVSAGDLSILNDVVEGRDLIITANKGEIIKAHSNFRIIATANTQGNGDFEGIYHGCVLQNHAFLDRWRYFNCAYLSEEKERLLLRKIFPEIKKTLENKLVQFSTELRTVIVGNPQDKNRISSLDTPFSTRTLVKIAKLLHKFNDISPWQAIYIMYAARLWKDEQEYVKRLTLDIFGYTDEESKKKARRKTIKLQNNPS